MKRLIIISLFILVLVTVYFLFEPIFLHAFGRKPLPDLGNLQSKIQHSDSIGKQTDKLLKKAYLKFQSPALSVAIGMNNKLVWANTIGYADINNRIAADTLTKFRIGSTSKALTSAGIGLLIKNKKLNLQSKIKEFVPYASKQLFSIMINCFLLPEQILVILPIIIPY